MLDKLTPCMKTLQASHFSPSEGNKTTLKKSHRTSGAYDPSNTKVSFDFSNLEMLPKGQEPAEVLMNLRKTSLNS